MIVATVIVVAAFGLAIGIGLGQDAVGTGAGGIQTFTFSDGEPPRDGDPEVTPGNGAMPSLRHQYRSRCCRAPS